MDAGGPIEPGMVPPSGTVDRASLLWLYVGVASQAIADIWTDVSRAAGSWSNASPESGTWATVTPAPGSWTDA